MSDIMRQIHFGQLMNWALTEHQQKGSIFGINKFYKKYLGDSTEIFGSDLEIPFGPAAGPHSQLAQNIIAAYVSGSRFFELKTVQILDGEDLPVSKPCISAPDECYNVEWSTELYVPQAMDEYIKAWFALKLLSKELELGSPDGFVFNMSVGYDLEGIKSEKINNFIEGLKDASSTESWKNCVDWALENVHMFEFVDEDYIRSVRPNVCNSITLSTLHGCPPDEIERIAAYLLKEKNLHTFIKCNPTLLGYEFARKTLNDLGFDYLSFDDHHFKFDLQFDDAVPMLKRLIGVSKELGLEFGVKLTNTFPVKITENELGGEEMYMSGRPLFPLSIEAANRLSAAFDGELRISFSGGADAFNIREIYEAGIFPITAATTLLKPGGYTRVYQIAEILDKSGCRPFTKVNLRKLQALAIKARNDDLYRKPEAGKPDRKINEPIPITNCFTAPCTGGCPLKQDVPAYLRLAGQGKYLEALRVITQRNPLPFITGSICPHNCTDKCTRSFYEDSVEIREVKLDIAKKAFNEFRHETSYSPKSGGKVAVIGGGPAGLSAAFFLSRAGKDVTIFEKTDMLGGIVTHVIPDFRISPEFISNDIALISSQGMDIRLSTAVTDLNELKEQGFEKFVIATGAWKPGMLKLIEGDSENALDFLHRFKYRPETVKLGENVVIVGGGNTAMDAARAAKRVKGVKSVSILYRRSKREMPADIEEINFALRDGVKFLELLSPHGLSGGQLSCIQMKLGDKDSSGRRRPLPTENLVEIAADYVISAIGDNVDSGLYKSFGIETDDKGFAVKNPDTLECSQRGVYIIGDAMRGTATVAEAIADAITCAESITQTRLDKYAELNSNPDIDAVEDKKGVLIHACGSLHQSLRCLECETVCGCCVDVCPNRANIFVETEIGRQVVHVDYMCNECGNCETFCPYTGAPYRDKFTIFACDKDFEDSKNNGFVAAHGLKSKVRLNNAVVDLNEGHKLPDDIHNLMQAVMEKEYLLSDV